MHNFYFSNNINTKWFIFFGLILHVLASYFTVGYYNADEHYQVIGPLEKLLNVYRKELRSDKLNSKPSKENLIIEKNKIFFNHIGVG